MMENKTIKVCMGLVGIGLAVLVGRPWALADGVPSDENALVYEGTIQRDGAPYDGSAEILVALFSEAASAGAPTFAQVASNCGGAGLERCECSVSDVIASVGGRFAVTLPAECFDAVHAHPDLWVEVRAIISGSEESFGRTRLSAAPYALEADTADQARLARDSLDGVPVGGVIDWWRPASGAGSEISVPTAFVVCDGRMIESGPMRGQSAPDLTDRFVLSVSMDRIGATGGADSQSAWTTSNGSHYHQWGRMIDNAGDDNQFEFCTNTGCGTNPMRRLHIDPGGDAT